MSFFNERKLVFLFGVLSCIYLISYFYRLYPAVIALEMREELGMSLDTLTSLTSVTMLAYGVFQLPSGIISDIFGPKKTIVFFTLLGGSASFVYALSSSYWVMLVCNFLTGAGIACTVPILSLLARTFPAHSYGRATSLLLATSGIGGILATQPLVYLSSAIGWRFSVMLFACMYMVLGFVLWFGVKIPEKEGKTSEHYNFRQMFGNLKLVFSNKQFWAITLWYMLNLGTVFALHSFWWGPYLVEACGLTKNQTGIILSVVALSMLVSQPIFGYISDVALKSRRKPIIFATAGSLIVALPWVFFTGSMGFALLFVQIVAVRFFIAGVSPLALTAAKENFSVYITGTVLGCINMFFPMWSWITQNLFGFVHTLSLDAGATQPQAYTNAFWVIIVNFLASFLVCLFIKETYNKNVQEKE